MSDTKSRRINQQQRGRVMDVLEEAVKPMSADEIAEAAALSTKCVQRHLKHLSDAGMCHHALSRGRALLYRLGRAPAPEIVRDPVLSALTFGRM